MAHEHEVRAFRTIPIESPYVVQTLRKRLADRRNECVGMMANGYCASYDDYCKRAGEINGLDQAVSICDELIKQQGE